MFGLCCCNRTYTFVKFEATGSPPSHDWRKNSLTGFTNSFNATRLRRIIATNGDIHAVYGGWDENGSKIWDEDTDLIEQASQHDVSADGNIYGVATSGVRKLNNLGQTQWTTGFSTAPRSISQVQIAHSTSGVYAAYEVADFSWKLALFDEDGVEQFEVTIDTSDEAGFANVGKIEGIGASCVVSWSNGNDASGENVGLTAHDNTGSRSWEYPNDNNYGNFGTPRFRNGSIYMAVTKSGTRYLAKITTGGSETSLLDISSLVSGFFTPDTPAIDSSDNYYWYTTSGTAGIKKYNSSLSLQWTYATSAATPYVGADDILYAGYSTSITP